MPSLETIVQGVVPRLLPGSDYVGAVVADAEGEEVASCGEHVRGAARAAWKAAGAGQAVVAWKGYVVYVVRQGDTVVGVVTRGSS